MLLVLDILGQHFAEEDRAEALRLLHTISVASSKYAEMICESRGRQTIHPWDSNDRDTEDNDMHAISSMYDICRYVL